MYYNVATNERAIGITRAGVGRPLIVNMSIDPERLGLAMKYLFVAEFLYGTLITLVKISILSLYQRTFPSPFIKTSCYVLGSLSLAW